MVCSYGRFYSVVLSIGFAFAVGPQSRALAVVVPNAQTDTEGNEASEFLTGDSRATSVRYQQVFAGSQFGGAGRINRITFRPDSVRGTPFFTTLSNVRISLSTTPKSPDGLSNSFSENIGSDELVVFNGDLPLSSSDLPGPNTTRAFDIVINLTNGFDFNPALGNLLFDFERDASPLNPLGVSFDAHDATGDSISRVIGARSSATGFAMDTTGLVARFDNIPEPQSILILGTAALGFGLLRRRPRC